MIVKRVTGTHSSIIMAINKLYGWSLRSLSVGRDQVFYICSEYMVYYYTRDDREVAGIYTARKRRRSGSFFL